MLIFLIVGGLFKLLESQLLYPSGLVKNTILHDGMLSEQHILLENCDKLLQDERGKSIEMARNVNKLTKKTGNVRSCPYDPSTSDQSNR